MKKRNYKLIIKDKRMKKTILTAALIVSLVLLMGATVTVKDLIVYGSLSSVKGQTRIYVEDATDNLYMVFMARDTVRPDKVWDATNSEFDDITDAVANWSTWAVPQTDHRAYNGGWKYVIPTDLPDGDYDCIPYSGAAPATTDTRLDVGRMVRIRKGQFISLDVR